MPSLGNLWYTMGIKDLTDADLKRINEKLKNVGSELAINPKLARDIKEILPKGITLELDPRLKAVSNEALARAVEGKVMRVAVTPLLTGFREAITRATRENPALAEVGVQEGRLRTIIQNVLNRQGFMLNISTVNDNYSRVVQQKLNGTRYTVKIHADANEITRSVQASLMQIQSRYFGLRVSRDILYRSIDEALGSHRFPIAVYVKPETARSAVQTALNGAAGLGAQDVLSRQRLATAEYRSAQAELARVKAAQMGAADAAKAHASASVNLGGAMGSNIKIAGELGSAMASLYSIHAAKEFLSQVVEIGGELEHQKIAMDTIFGDKGKTNTLSGQIKGLARQSPFGVMELTKSVKALSAYGVEYNEIYDTAKRLADISAATSVDINRLILAFGKTKSRGFLDGLEAKQFAYANIPIYEMVRKKLEELEGQAVTTADVMARMKKREISFDIVKDVLWDITDPGGKFYDMQEALAGSVKTSWKLVRDNVELMFGEIAESSVGSGLKSLAEVLQGLTREWRTVATVVGMAAAGLGIYRVATLGVNGAVQKETITLYGSIMAQKQKNAEDLKAWGRISQLTKAELMRIATANKLTNADLRQAMAADTLTEKHIAQLFWQKKITAAQVRYLASIGMLDPTMSNAILKNNRFTLSLQMMKGALAKAGAATKAFLLNPWTIGIAAMSSLTTLWQHMGEQSDKAKELGENLSTKATEGAKNLTEALKGLNGEFAQMSDLQLSGTIEKLEQTIKDYGIFADRVLFYSQVDESGMERTLAQRAEYLYHQSKILEEAYAKFKDWKVGDMVGQASESTNGNFWTANWYDGLQEDIDDYVKDVRNAQKELTNYLRDHEDEAKLVVKFAAEIDSGFADQTRDMGIEQAMNALMSDLDRLQKVYDSIPRVSGRLKINGQDLYKFAGLADSFTNNWNNTDVRHSMEEVLREQDTFMASLRTSILAKDKDFFKNLTEEKKVMLGIAFQEAFRGLEGLDDQYIMPFVTRWNNYFGTAFDPSFIEGQIQSQFKSLIPELGEELAKKVRNGEQLETAEKEKVKALFDKAVDVVKNTWPGKAAEIQKIVDSNPVYANILISVNNRAGMDQWKQEIDDAFGNSPEITALIKGEADTQSTLKALGELKKTTKVALDKFALSFKIKPDFGNLAKLSTDGPLNAFERQQREEYNKFVDLWNSITKGEKTLGVDLQEEGKNRGKGSGSQKDSLAESLRQRFKDIKDAYAMYKKWAKLEGDDAAFKRVGESGLFSTLAPDKIPQTAEEYRRLIDELEGKLKAAGIKGHNQRENLFNDIIKERFGIDEDAFKEQLQTALDEVSREAERQLANWNLFENVRKATGDKRLAMNIAFGIGATGETDYESLMKDKFNAIAKAYKSELTFDTVTPDLLEKAAPELKKVYDEASKEIEKFRDKEREEVADMVEKYRSAQEEIVALTEKAEEEKDRIRRSKNLTPVEKTQLVARVDADLNYEVFRKSGEYLKFFNAILSITGREAETVGRKIKDALDQKLKAGRISAKDYCEEMERIDRQLEKIRQKQKGFGGVGSLVRGGVQGMYEDRYGQAQSDYNAAVQRYIDAKDLYDTARREGNRSGMKLAEADMKAAESMKEGATAAMEGAQSALQTVRAIDAIVHGINDTVQGIKGAFDLISEMAASFGMDVSADTGWGAANAFLGAFSQASQHATDAWDSLKSGNIGGVIKGVVGSVTSWFTTFNQWHDAKLQEQIEAQQRVYDLLDRQLGLIADRLNFELGSARQIKDPQAEADRARFAQLSGGYRGTPFPMQTGKEVVERLTLGKRVEAYEKGGVYGYQRQLMEEQMAALQAQRAAEADKKNSDSNAIADYDNQIASLQQQIRDFAETTIETLYGINLRSFAEDIGSALIDAFAKGEDAAEAFDKAVGDIMRDVVKQMAVKNILEKQFEGMRTFLFGTDGASGAFGEDFYLDESEAATLKTYFDNIKEKGIPAVKNLYESFNEAAGGILDETESSKSGMTAGIQALTENTGDLLASYINGIRGDVSVQTHDYWPKLIEALPQISVVTQAQLDVQRQIAVNTLRNAVAAEAIVKLNDEINRRLARVTQGSEKLHIQ